MFSKAFMKFLLGYNQDEKLKEKENTAEEIEFKSIKVQQAAQVVIASIKDSY